MRFIDPVLRRPEVRFLSERVVIDGEHVVAPLRRVRKLLGENRAVSITVTYLASTVYAHPFLGGTLQLPAGPIELSAATGAPLLPVFTWNDDGRTCVEFGAPVPISGSSPDAVREAHRWAIAWLEERVVAHPEAWIAWRTRQFAV
jgi:lauroyl/myristoyl acyltransferase